jgi:hypothetical protein
MEGTIMQTAARTPQLATKALWAGRILSSIVVLFLVFDAVMKVVKEPHVVEATVSLGYPPSLLIGIGLALLVCTIVYVTPRTSILGAVLLTGYLGGAIASNMRVGHSVFECAFPVIVGGLIWGGLFLRDDGLHALLPLRR